VGGGVAGGEDEVVVIRDCPADASPRLRSPLH
jgi:hypothetical protein